ncbi:hypothetical protein HCN44_000963 [Aphidius gifuensis]|uniref:Uncharacterized protein n=1 Tax=Aphidius gifuensis TaxID=684658 RepID=A0A834XND9_APHGI|nr:hypothetical protein HCN44_000963 [Aphidius gifuensis]
MERYFEYAEETTTNSRRKIHGLKSQPKKPYDSTSYTSHQIESDNVQKCMIKYEDEFSEHSIRFVSLQLKTTFPNYFVTGIRLKITNQILHLEIQQGKMSNGKILNNTIHWLPSSKQTIYHKEMLVDVSKTNGFFMNDVEFEDGNFLTGVGFQVLDSYDKNGEIKLLTIIAQRQDLKPQSDVSKRQWLRKLPDTDALLIELKLNEPDLSIKANSSKVLSTPDKLLSR